MVMDAILDSMSFSKLVVRNRMFVWSSMVSILWAVVCGCVVSISILWSAFELSSCWGFVVMIAVGVVVVFIFVRCVMVWLLCSPMPMMRGRGWFVWWVASAGLRVPCHSGCKALLVCFLPDIFFPPPNLCG